MITIELNYRLFQQIEFPCDFNPREQNANFYDGFMITHFSPSVTNYKRIQ